jgi:hypothetical protein
MKLKKTPVALALAGGLFLSGASMAAQDMRSASEPVLITYEVYEPVVIHESGFVGAPESATETFYIVDAPQDPHAGFERVLVEPVIIAEPVTWTYYLVPGTRDSQMPNPVPPSESNSWGE